MRLRHIELFQAILQSGSLTAAAELLCISQPAVSKALKHAEQTLGFPLFTRTRGKLHPTEEALILSRETERLSHDLNSIRRLANTLRRGEVRPIRLVGTPTLVQTLIPDTICQWRKIYPDAPCELASHHTYEIIQSLLLNESDIGLTLQPVTHPNITSRIISEGDMMVIAPPGWWKDDLLGYPLTFGDLEDIPLIALNNEDTLGSALHSQFFQFSSPPKIKTWVQTYHLARKLVSAKQGLALVDPFTALDSCKEPVEVRFIEPKIPVRLYALSRNDRTSSVVENKLLEIIKGLANNLINK